MGGNPNRKPFAAQRKKENVGPDPLAMTLQSTTETPAMRRNSNMHRFFAPLFLVYASFFLAPQSASAVTIDTVPVGNVGNANDPSTGSLYGGVGYAYNIGRYEVTLGQYTAFLNAVAATDTYNLYIDSMASDLNIAGISQSGVSGSYSYSVIGSANKPVTYVGWGDAARFSNWLHNGQPTGAQNARTTEDGAYPLNGATTDAALQAVSRSAGANWFIPTDNEWYKAAYYNPGSSSYFQYPTSSNTAPTAEAPPGGSNSANYNYVVGNTYSGWTDVGAYTSSRSPYGTFDQGGNVEEWNETLVSYLGGSFRRLRGGNWGGGSGALRSSAWFGSNPTGSSNAETGFRVASTACPPLRQIGQPWSNYQWAPNQVRNFIEYLERLPPGVADTDVPSLPQLKLAYSDGNGVINFANKGCLATCYAMGICELGLGSPTPGDVYNMLTFTPIKPKSGVAGQRGEGIKLWSDNVNKTGVPYFDGADPNFQDLVKRPAFSTLRWYDTAIIPDLMSALDSKTESVFLNVHGGSHWVLADHIDSKPFGLSTADIVDPGKSGNNNDGIHSLSSADLNFVQGRILYGGTGRHASVRSHSPVEFLVTSPSGKRLGFDSATQEVVNDLAKSSYSIEYPILGPDVQLSDADIASLLPHLPRTASINELELGQYQMSVLGLDDGAFGLDFDWYDEDGTTHTNHWDGVVTKGEILTYIATVPEPSALALLAVAAMAACARPVYRKLETKRSRSRVGA